MEDTNVTRDFEDRASTKIGRQSIRALQTEILILMGNLVKIPRMIDLNWLVIQVNIGVGKKNNETVVIFGYLLHRCSNIGCPSRGDAQGTHPPPG